MTEKIGDQMIDRRNLLWHMGEDFAAQMLEDQGWHILERNWKDECRKNEIDIIAFDPEDVLVFIEIKARITITEPGVSMHGLESVGYTKQRKIIRAASSYLHYNRLVEHGGRIDVIVVTFVVKNKNLKLNVIDQAFLLSQVHSPQATHIKQAFY